MRTTTSSSSGVTGVTSSTSSGLPYSVSSAARTSRHDATCGADLDRGVAAYGSAMGETTPGDGFKVVYVARFREGMAREEARSYWTDVHAPMADALPDMYRYVQSHVVGA